MTLDSIAWAAPSSEQQVDAMTFTDNFTYSSGTGSIDVTMNWNIFAADDVYSDWIASDESVSNAFSASYDGLAIRGEIYTETTIDRNLSPSLNGGPIVCLYKPSYALNCVQALYDS